MYVCGNCDKRWDDADLKVRFPNIPDLLERLDPGGTVPAGECPACGALAYPENRADVSKPVPSVVLEALRHAYSRLNAIPHRYDDTNFRLIREAVAAAEGGVQPVRLLILLEGGLVQEVLADKPGVEVAVLNMDLDGVDEDEIVDVVGEVDTLRGTLEAHDVTVAPVLIESAWRPVEPETTDAH
jgi:hypothetical protein